MKATETPSTSVGSTVEDISPQFQTKGTVAKYEGSTPSTTLSSHSGAGAGDASTSTSTKSVSGSGTEPSIKVIDTSANHVPDTKETTNKAMTTSDHGTDGLTSEVKRKEKGSLPSDKKVGAASGAKTFFTLNNVGTYDLGADNKGSTAAPHTSSEITIQKKEKGESTTALDATTGTNTRTKTISSALPLTTFVTPNSGFASGENNEMVVVSYMDGTKRNVTKVDDKE